MEGLLVPIYYLTTVVATALAFYAGIRLGHYYGSKGVEPPKIKIERRKVRNTPPGVFIPRKRSQDVES